MHTLIDRYIDNLKTQDPRLAEQLVLARREMAQAEVKRALEMAKARSLPSMNSCYIWAESHT